MALETRRTLLYTATASSSSHLDRRPLAAKDLIAPRYAYLVYEGRWFDLSVNRTRFVEITQQRVPAVYASTSGSVSVGRASEYALYTAIRHVLRDYVYQRVMLEVHSPLPSRRVRALRDQASPRAVVPCRRRMKRRCLRLVAVLLGERRESHA